MLVIGISSSDVKKLPENEDEASIEVFEFRLIAGQEMLMLVGDNGLFFGFLAEVSGGGIEEPLCFFKFRWWSKVWVCTRAWIVFLRFCDEGEGKRRNV